MSTIVLGVGASHSTLMNTHWHEVATLDRAQQFRAALDEASGRIRDAAPDVAVIIGSNHFRGLWLDLLPAFTIGVGDCDASGESGSPEGPQPVDLDLARHVCSTLVDVGFDLAFSLRLQIDHGISHAIQHLLGDLGVPIVPIVVNVFAPPRPSLARCDALGRALGAAIRSDGSSRRVVVIGSGGLSHTLPFPRWDAPASDDDEFLVGVFTEGRGSWRDADVRRRSIIRAAKPDVREAVDRELLDRFARGELAEVAAWSDDELEARGGNGAHEIRAWLMMAAACGHAPGRALAYAPMPEWLTGMAVGVIDRPLSREPTETTTRGGTAR